MNQDDEKFERYLRQFRPRAPSRLPARVPAFPLVWRARFALAAAVFVLGSVVAWLATKEHHHVRTSPFNKTILPARQVTHSVGPSEVSLARLNATMRISPSELDAALMDISRQLLPHVENSRGSLHVLAGE